MPNPRTQGGERVGMGEPVVVGRDVWKIYGSGETEVAALKGLDLEVVRGEMVAIMGPSGCGKTTLLNCFSGLDDVTKGRVTLEGTDIHAMSDRKKSEYRAKRTCLLYTSPSPRDLSTSRMQSSA